jgi:hypothetical protein
MFNKLNSLAGTLGSAGVTDKAELQIKQFLSENWPAISQAVSLQVGTAALDALRDERMVGQVGKIAYGFLPGLVRVVMTEQDFIKFLTDNRMKAIEWIGAVASKG